MNLALECLEEFSDLGFEDLVSRIQPAMPRHFLLSTAELQPGLEPHREDIAALADAIVVEGERAAWRNPEVYAQIALLAKAAEQGGEPAPALELLRVQLGLVPFERRHLTDGPVRLVHVDGSIRVRRGADVERVDEAVVASVRGLPAAVLLPYEGLYRDLLGPDLYRDDVQPYERAALIEKIEQAIDLLELYAPDVWSDFRGVIQTIVLIPDLHDARQWSYNLRLGYFGAIFVNPFAADRHGLAEALLHEYFHQRLWQWWTYDPPAGLPPESVRIRSPVTDREKPAIVMLQALLIYIAAHRFYADVAAREETLTRDEQDWIERRIAKFSAAIPELGRALLEHVPEQTTAALVVDRALETFAEPVR